MRLRFLPGAAEPEVLPEPFEYLCPVTNNDRHHIVRRDGEQYLYDAATRTYRPLKNTSPVDGHDAQPALSPDGSYVAYFVPGDIGTVVEPGIGHFNYAPTTGKVVLLDLHSGEEDHVEIMVYTGFGSGRLVLVGGAPTFDKQGRMRFLAIPADRISSVGPAQAVFQEEHLALSEFCFDPRTKAVEPVPPAEAIECAQHHADDGHDTAWAFLMAQGIEPTRPRVWSNTRVGFTADRARFLLKCFGVGLDDTFFLADTATNSLTRVTTPPALLRANALNIIHIPSPAP